MSEIEQAIAYLKPIANSATVGTYSKHLNVAIQALEKQVAKKMIKAYFLYSCPVCGAFQNEDKKTDIKAINYCWKCGQKIFGILEQGRD